MPPQQQLENASENIASPVQRDLAEQHVPTISGTDSVPQSSRGKYLRIFGICAGVMAALVVAFLVWGYYLHNNEAQITMNSDTNEKSQSGTSVSSVESFTFSGKQYIKAYTLPDSTTELASESYEWVTDGESLENWTTLVTTHKIRSARSQPSASDFSAEGYAQNVADLQTKNGALILEASLINQDMEALGIDPANPPYLLVYLYATGGVTEFNMQKIQTLPDGSIGSVIYAERFPTKSDAEMKQYYDSAERTAKRTDLIKFPFPY